jgi:hypothetical protein
MPPKGSKAMKGKGKKTSLTTADIASLIDG